MHASIKDNQAGFTLIELLVVISIIAILVGILLPVLGKARKASYAARCQSNLHQIGVAMFAYATDHDDFLPDAQTTGGHGYRIEPGTELGTQYGPAFAGIGAGGDPIEKLGLAAVLQDQEYMQASGGTWVCPAARPEFQENGNTYTFSTDASLATTRTFIYGIDGGTETPIVWDSFNLQIGLPNGLGISIPGTNLAAVPPDYFVHNDNAESVLKSTHAVYIDGHVSLR
ncbi:MAG: type II secretion system protein [Planctomycetota bacterium]